MEVVRQQWEEGLIDRTWEESLSLVRMTKILIRRRIIERKTFFRSSLVGKQDGGCGMGEARHCVHLCQWSGHCQQWPMKGILSTMVNKSVRIGAVYQYKISRFSFTRGPRDCS